MKIDSGDVGSMPGELGFIATTNMAKGWIQVSCPLSNSWITIQQLSPAVIYGWMGYRCDDAKNFKGSRK